MTIGFIYSEYLVRPLFNILVWIYSNYAQENFGYAVIIFTIGLRIVLLPLTVVGEWSKVKYKRFLERAKDLERTFKGDRIALKSELRRAMKEYHLKPWAGTLVLIIQAFVLVLLYSVFKVGIKNGFLVSSLYSWVLVPGRLNLDFFGFNVGQSNFLWALAVGAWLFLDILYAQRKQKKEKKDLIYAILFPVFSIAVLYALPMIKSIFVLTSMAFSAIISVIEFFILAPKKGEDREGHAEQEEHS